MRGRLPVVKGHGPLTAAKWNASCPIGTRVAYYQCSGVDECVETTTRSEAWTFGHPTHGEHVVAIEGRAGGVSLRHLRLLLGAGEEAPRG